MCPLPLRLCIEFLRKVALVREGRIGMLKQISFRKIFLLAYLQIRQWIGMYCGELITVFQMRWDTFEHAIFLKNSVGKLCALFLWGYVGTCYTHINISMQHSIVSHFYSSIIYPQVGGGKAGPFPLQSGRIGINGKVEATFSHSWFWEAFGCFRSPPFINLKV